MIQFFISHFLSHFFNVPKEEEEETFHTHHPLQSRHQEFSRRMPFKEEKSSQPSRRKK